MTKVTVAPTSIKNKKIQTNPNIEGKRDSLSDFKDPKLIASYQDIPIFQCCIVYCVLSRLIT